MNLLETKSMTFSYGQTRILNDINFELKQGQIWAFVGPNGSGKSTLLRCLCGLLRPCNGEVYLQGKSLKGISRKKIARKICMLPQNHVSLHYMSVYELVAMGRSPHQNMGWCICNIDREKINWAIDYMNLKHLQHRSMDTLSGGERQRVWIAMILAQDTPIVLLDEPVTFLDMKYQWYLIDKILDIRNTLQKSFIVVLHDINHAMALADRILVLKDGSAYCSGKPSDIITSRLLQEVYDIEANIINDEQYTRPVIVPRSICRCQREKGGENRRERIKI
jgi:ABC-type cobalamin/Fe3+-siderophores transport system ATPase subunit